MKKTVKIISYIFILYFLISAGVFFAIKYGITNTYGKVDDNNEIFAKSNEQLEKISQAEVANDPEKQSINKVANRNFCQIKMIYELYPTNAKKIIEEYKKNKCDPLVSKMILAVNLRLKNNVDFQGKTQACGKAEDEIFKIEDIESKPLTNESANVFAWIDLPEWKIIEEAVLKDKEQINKASNEAGIAPRLLVASMIVEQLRLFNSQRELFKKFFEPLKILGNSTKISWGVIGIKEATAIKVENNLKDVNSPYYLGKSFENKLDFSTNNSTQERFLRITNEKDHYYSYLYGAFYLAQMMKQWRSAGFEIMYRPEIVGTLFNVGFPQSKPNPNPKVGGSEINVGEGKYSFGSLAYEFYYSGELAEEFPLYFK